MFFNHYNSGVLENSALDTLLRKKGNQLGIQLSVKEQKAIEAFLNTLTDEAFITQAEHNNLIN